MGNEFWRSYTGPIVETMPYNFRPFKTALNDALAADDQVVQPVLEQMHYLEDVIHGPAVAERFYDHLVEDYTWTNLPRIGLDPGRGDHDPLDGTGTIRIRSDYDLQPDEYVRAEAALRDALNDVFEREAVKWVRVQPAVWEGNGHRLVIGGADAVEHGAAASETVYAPDIVVFLDSTD